MYRPAMNKYSGRDVAGLLVVLVGLGIIASGLIINPWVPRIWQGPLIVDRMDVMGESNGSQDGKLVGIKDLEA